MQFLKKYWPFLIATGILLLYFLTRLANLTGLPIFTDEAIYIRWSQIAGNDANWRFISLTDGKQPLYVWIAMILLKFIEDPLFAGRLVSVIAGVGSVIGMFFLTNEVFKNRKTAFFASFLYVIYPFALVYDRLALYDSLVAMITIWALYFEFLLVRKLRLDIALLLGMIMGVGLLTKSNTNFALILLPFSLVLFDFKQKHWRRLLGKWFLLALVAAGVALAMSLVLRLSPFYHIIGEKNLVFIYSFSDWIARPFAFFVGNFTGLGGWLLNYMTIPVVLLVLSSFLVSKKYFKEKLLLLAWFIVPFMALAFFGKVIYPRFILFMTMPLLVLAAYAFVYMMTVSRKAWFRLFIVIVFLTLPLFKDYFIITDFAHAPIPKSDLTQLVRGWPAGGGVNETVAFLKEKAKTEKIYVGTGGTFGLMPYALEIYLHDNPNITIKGFWPINDTAPKEVIDASKTMPTYFVFYQECPSCSQIGFAPAEWPATPVLRMKKAEQNSFYTLYEIK